MRASSKYFITDERHLGRGRRLNLVWHHLQGKAGIVTDVPNTTHSVARIADRDMMLSGTAITSATSAATVEGGKRYTVVAGDTNVVCMEPNTLANGSPWTEIDWATDEEIEWEAHIRYQNGSLATRDWKIGLGLVPSTADLATDDDYVGFWAADDGVIDLVYNVAGGTDVAIAGVTTILADTILHLAIKFDKFQRFTPYINGVPITAAVKDFQAGHTALLLPFMTALEQTGATPDIGPIGMAMSKRLI